jgi:DME family drug/metabolite transporter
VLPALLVLAAAVLWGTTGTAQALGPHGIDPLFVGAGRLVGGGALLVAFAAAQGWRRSRRAGLAWRPWRGDGRWRRPGTPLWRDLLLASGCVAAYQLCFFAGVSRDGVAVGTLIAIGSAPVFTGLVAWLAGQGRPGWLWAAATLLAVGGCAFLVLGGTPGGRGTDAWGVVLALGAGLSYAGYTVGGKRLVTVLSTPTVAMAAIFGAAGALLLPVLIVRSPQPTGAVTVIAYLALVPTAVAYVLFGRGLAGLSAPIVATLSLGEPLVASILGVTVLGEAVTWTRLAGAVLIFCGLGLSMLAARAPRVAGYSADSWTVSKVPW